MGIGIVIGDEEVEVLVAMGGQRSNVDQPAIVESHTLWKAMEVCRDLSFNKVTFEGDIQVIANAINM